MKKIFVLMVLCTLSMSVSAQAVDSLQSNPISIDSLAVKLDKLQKDYDYLYCRYAIENTLNQFDDIANQANIKSNALLIEYYNHSKVDIELYIANRNYYDSLISLFNSAKERLIEDKAYIKLMISYSNFSEKEITILRKTCSLSDNHITSVETSLNYFKAVIDAYKNK